MSGLIRMSNTSGNGILVIEDMDEFESTIRTMLLREGLAREDEVRVAGTIRDAKDELRRAIPRAVVADYSLPDGHITKLASLLEREHVGMVVQTCHETIRVPANLDSIVEKPNSRTAKLALLAAVRGALHRPLYPEFTPQEIFMRIDRVVLPKPSHPAKVEMARTGAENAQLAEAGQVDIETVRKAAAASFRLTGTNGRLAARNY
jgi:DNA-binding response OmpR family regulator